jgi:DNA recombination protein RmuC
LTLSHKVELIKAGVHAKKLSEEAENVRKDLNIISQRFNEVDELWRVFYNTHLRNAGERAEELDMAYKKLRDEFDRILRMSKE